MFMYGYFVQLLFQLICQYYQLTIQTTAIKKCKNYFMGRGEDASRRLRPYWGWGVVVDLHILK